MEVDGGGEKLIPISNGESERNPSSNHGQEEEGRFLLGSPTFSDLGNGRLRCVETGHELPAKDRDSYACSKGCRLALIDAALSQNKPPLNMFKPSPLSKSKLVCKLTGDTINKSEEHIWKHITGRRFQNKLEQREVEKLASAENAEKDTKKARKILKSSRIAIKKGQKQDGDDNGSLAKEPAEHSSDSEEPGFWIHDGRDHWEACATSGHKIDDGNDLGEDDKDEAESMELSMRTKRMSIAVGPSSFASRKKKIKKTLPSTAD